MATQVEVDPQETREWLEALDAVVASDGPQRAQFLLERVVGHAQLSGATPAPAGNTPDLNTIPPQAEPEYRGFFRNVGLLIQKGGTAWIVVHSSVRPA